MRPNDFVDYYEILGLQPGASAEEVRDAWRRCARLYHPDLNPRKTSFRFRRAKEAYETLSDPQRRKDYDRIHRVRASIFNRSTGRHRSSTFVGNPPGSKPPARPPGGTTRTPGSARPAGQPPAAKAGPSAGRPASPTGNKSGRPADGARPADKTRPADPAPNAAPPPGARTSNPAGPIPGSSDVRTRTTFRPATVFQEVGGNGMVDYLKEAVTQGGVSRVTIRHNSNVVWQAHITSSLMDDLARWLVTPLMGLLRLLGQDEKFHVELTNELVEQYNRANTYYDDGKLNEAKVLYKQCIERDKYFAPAHLSLGAVYEAQGEVGVAIDCYRNAVKIDPAGEAGRFARENLRRLRGY